MFKKVVIVVFFLGMLTSCNRTYEQAMKSSEPEFILNAADKLYEEEKWPYAIELYGRVASSFAGTEIAEEIAYKSAQANFNDKNYPLAARQFKNFYLGFNRSEKAEEALFMSAFSYYQGSPKYNLDQTNTYEAISELQNFIDTYPTSTKVREANQYINELQHKLEKKYFEIAKAYYKTLRFKAASVSFSNFLTDFPDSDLVEEANMYLLRSRSELAINSVFDKKDLRLRDAATTYRLFIRTYPESKFKKEADDLMKDITRETAEHAELLSQIKEQENKNTQS